MLQPKVSIIVPVYNAQNYLEQCINSLRNQTLEDIEIILVDDSSLDDSLLICQKAEEEDSRIKVIHKENEGAGKARNAGILAATGKYIGFVDSDDYVDDRMYQTLYEKAEQYGSDLVMSGVVFVDGNTYSEAGGCVIKTYFEKDTHFETDEQLKRLRMGIVGATPIDADDSKYGMGTVKNLFKNEIIKENHIVYLSERETFSEDATFMVDYISCIKKATGISEAFYYYCRHGDSVSKSYQKDRFEKCMVFADEMEKKFAKDIAPQTYLVYLYRFWQAVCRVLCSQEITHALEHDVNYADLKKRLKTICTHSLSVCALKAYPINTLPFGQRVFAYAMKYRMYFLMKLLVKLRSR